MYILQHTEVEKRIRFDLARVKYTIIYGDSIFVKCKTCNGTGLGGITKFENSIGWDCNSYCSVCEGFGGMFILGETIFKCDKCDGDIKCGKCAGTGYVDFLENILFHPNSTSYDWKSRIPSRERRDVFSEWGW